MFADIFNQHVGTIRGLVGIALAEALSFVTPILTVVVLLLTAYNLLLEIRKKQKKD